MKNYHVSPGKKFLSLFTILITVMIIAAQCGAQSGQLPAEDSGLEASSAQRGEGHAEAEGEQAMNATAIEALAPAKLAADEKLKVLATTNIVADLVRNVGSDMIDLTVMLPVGSDPHTFSPTPQDVAAVADADVVFINGLNFETFLGGIVENAGGEAVIITTTTGVEPRAFGGHDEADEASEHDHDEEFDPHAWMTPVNAVVMVHNIEAALSALDLANADTYRANAEAYVAELETLDSWVMEQIATIPPQNRKMATDHDSFGYYADYYGLEIIGAVIPAFSTNAEPSAQEMAALQDEISQYDVKAIFVGTTVNPILAEQVSVDTGIQLVPLYTGSLGGAGSGAETYLDFIRYNTAAIVEALQ